MANFNEKLSNGYDNLTESEKKIVSYLPSGKDNCKTAKELEPFTGLPQNQLSVVARRALDVGYPVLACRNGFYIATCDSEVAEYIQREESRDLKHAKTIEACNRFLQT